MILYGEKEKADSKECLMLDSIEGIVHPTDNMLSASASLISRVESDVIFFL